ncbi:hypothetical protein P261_02442 [Lachnospiraceae bacterium TWA4]|nr:hypothetical protein P261_02442 [Lachnospiraceae bacterium TWA4]
MADITNKKAMLLQNLQDAGLDDEHIKCCMSMAEEYSDVKMLPTLLQYRTVLLDTIHEKQDKLECLDYLIFQLQSKKQTI